MIPCDYKRSRSNVGFGDTWEGKILTFSTEKEFKEVLV